MIQPLTVATLGICIVFFPVLLLTGPARFLFIPLGDHRRAGDAGVLRAVVHRGAGVRALAAQGRTTTARQRSRLGARLSAAFDRGFDRFRDGLRPRRWPLCCGAGSSCWSASALLLVVTGALAPVVGTDFFPTADVGIIKLHVRAPRGTRLEETEQIVLAVEERIREIIPAGRAATINDMIGVPFSLNLAFVPSDNVSGMDARDADLAQASRTSRRSNTCARSASSCADDFPGTIFYFQTADIVSQVLNFGLSAPIDIQIQDPNFTRAYAPAQRLLQALQRIPGVVDAHYHAGAGLPGAADRRRPAARRPARRRAARRRQQHADLAVVAARWSAPTYFLNPQNGVNYIVAVQARRSSSCNASPTFSTFRPIRRPARSRRRPRR